MFESGYLICSDIPPVKIRGCILGEGRLTCVKHMNDRGVLGFLRVQRLAAETSEHKHPRAHGRHRVARSWRRRRSHFLEHIPSLVCEFGMRRGARHQYQLKGKGHSLDTLKAPRSPRSFPSTPLPPKTYTTSSTIAAEWPSRGEGMKPMQVNSVHVLVLVSNAQVSL